MCYIILLAKLIFFLLKKHFYILFFNLFAIYSGVSLSFFPKIKILMVAANAIIIMRIRINIAIFLLIIFSCPSFHFVVYFYCRKLLLYRKNYIIYIIFCQYSLKLGTQFFIRFSNEKIKKYVVNKISM